MHDLEDRNDLEGMNDMHELDGLVEADLFPSPNPISIFVLKRA